MKTALVIRHFPDRKKPCLMLEQGNQGIVIATIRNTECEKLLREFFNDSCGIYGDMREMFNHISGKENDNEVSN